MILKSQSENAKYEISAIFAIVIFIENIGKKVNF